MQAMCAGFLILLPKPVDVTELVATVARSRNRRGEGRDETLNDGGAEVGTVERQRLHKGTRYHRWPEHQAARPRAHRRDEDGDYRHSQEDTARN